MEFYSMEKEIDEKKQGQSLVLNQKEGNTKKLFIESYGCQMNFSDSEIVASILYENGYNTTQNLEDADLVLVNLNDSFKVTPLNVFYKCGWSPFEGTEFPYSIQSTFVNGHLVYHQGQFNEAQKGSRMQFTRN